MRRNRRGGGGHGERETQRRERGGKAGGAHVLRGGRAPEYSFLMGVEEPFRSLQSIGFEFRKKLAG